MPRFKAIVEYNGKNYHGFQIQDNAVTVQSELERAFLKTFNKSVKVIASGRTDSGVHALGQVIHFDCETSIPSDKIPFAINVNLPQDISILSCELTNNDFHARYSAKRKTYRYSVVLSKLNRPMCADRSWIYPFDIDLQLLNIASQKIIGEHNFVAFMASGSNICDTVRNIFDFKIERNDNLLEFYITANGFLYNMVRIIVGTLLDIARGRLAINIIDEAFERKVDRNALGLTAPAQGLCLYSVDYIEI